MATTYKVLGQSKPTAATTTTLYTVPASTSAVVSSLVITNITNDASNLRIAIQPAGEALADKHYIAYDQQIGAYGSRTYTIGMTLATTDVVSIRDSAGKCSFSLFGSEIS